MSDLHSPTIVHEVGTLALSASQLGAVPGIVKNMMHGALQSDNMNVHDEQSAHDEHGVASETREKVLTHTRYATKTYTTAPATTAPGTATTHAPETANTTTATTENEAAKGLASETRKKSRVVWVDLDTDSDVERKLDGERPARPSHKAKKGRVFLSKPEASRNRGGNVCRGIGHWKHHHEQDGGTQQRQVKEGGSGKEACL